MRGAGVAILLGPLLALGVAAAVSGGRGATSFGGTSWGAGGAAATAEVVGGGPLRGSGDLAGATSPRAIGTTTPAAPRSDWTGPAPAMARAPIALMPSEPTALPALVPDGPGENVTPAPAMATPAIAAPLETAPAAVPSPLVEPEMGAVTARVPAPAPAAGPAPPAWRQGSSFPADGPTSALAATAAAPTPLLGPMASARTQLEDLGPPPAPAVDPRPFAEAHWQGLEAIPKTPTLTQALKLPVDLPGVILDDVTLPADLQGFRAGDLVTAVDGVPTPNLVSFIRATDRIRDQKRVIVDFVRAGVPQRLELVALLKRLGPANGETPPMIPPSARRPHPYMGPCVNCHRIGTTGNLAADQGDPAMNTPAPVRLTDPVPHRDRGPCAACHPILP